MLFDLGGRVALVTGAGQGVGQGIARVLARQGAAVAVNDLVPDRAAAAADALASDGQRTAAAPFDVTDADDVARGVAEVERSLGPVDVLVNNAGVPASMALAPFLESDPEQWRDYVDLNLYGSMRCIRAVAPGMCDRGRGRIVQISSAAGYTGIPLGVGVYGASKAGIAGLLRNLAVEVARDGVTVNIVALGMMDNVPAEVVPDLSQRIPVGRLGTAADVGAAVAWLASDQAAWITGQTIHLNGGAFIA